MQSLKNEVETFIQSHPNCKNLLRGLIIKGENEINNSN